MITAVVECNLCKKPQEVKMTQDQLERIENLGNTGEHIQHILPYHSADDRELFVTGICPTCWTELFEDEE